MKFVFILLLWLINVCFLRGEKPEAAFAEDCYAHYVHTPQHKNISYSHRGGSTVQIGLLCPGSADFSFTDVGIFIYFSEDNYKGHIMLHVNQMSKLVLRRGQEVVAKSEKSIEMCPNSGPFWIYILVRIMEDDQNAVISILRPGDVTPLLRKEMKLGITKSSHFKYTVTSPQPIYVTFNCISECPIFGRDSQKFTNGPPIILKETFFLYIFPKYEGRPENSKEWYFEYQTKLTWQDDSVDDTTRNVTLHPAKKHKLLFTITDMNKSTEVRIDMVGHKPIMVNKPELNIKDVQFTVLNNSLNIWTFNCIPYNKTKGNGISTVKQATVNSFTSTKKPTQQRKEKTPNGQKGFLGIGEVIAWVVAVIALCGVFIMGLTLYTKVSSSPDEFINTISHIPPEFEFGDHQALRMAEFRPQVSFKRKQADECSEPRSSVPDPNMLIVSDQFYPLHITTDDEISFENEDLQIGSLDTKCTTLSKNSL